jgi:ABC-type amino acid transport substrate-binding protein
MNNILKNKNENHRDVHCFFTHRFDMKKLYLCVCLVLSMSLLPVKARSGDNPLRIACYRDYLPYAGVDDNGEMTGILPDLWRLWSKKSGIPIEFVPMNLNESIEAGASGKADIQCGLYYTEKRAERLTFSDALLRMRTVLFVREDISVKRIEELHTKVFIVNGDYAGTFLVEKFPQTTLSILPNYRELHAAVKNKTAEAFVYDYPRNLPGFKPMPPPDGYVEIQTLYTERLRAAVKRGNLDLIDKINKGFAQISDEELWEAASGRQFYEKDNTAIVIIGAGGGGALLLLLIAGFYIFHLRTHLRQSKHSADWRALIREGETDLVEFKSSLRFDMKLEKVNKVLEQVIAKTISAFLNAKGGILIIGVDDSGKVLGLENDYKTFSRKPNADGFLLALSALINNALGTKFHRFITAAIENEDEKDVCVITIRPADSPAFLHTGSGEEFYIRGQASSQPLGLKETHEYIVSRWPGK